MPLSELLAKFSGLNKTVSVILWCYFIRALRRVIPRAQEYKTYKDTHMKRFKLTSLPKYLLVHIKRFTKNTFFLEKNPTIVNFPIKCVAHTMLRR